MPTNKCKNCEKSIAGEFSYCPYCGQESSDKLTFGVLFSNTISNYFSIDARFFKSFIPLMIKPGVLARRFVDGKRLSYLHPAQFYLFISVVFFFVFSFSVREVDSKVSRALKQGFEKETILDSLQSKKDSLHLELSKEALHESGVLTGMSQEDILAIDSAIAIQKDGPEVDFGFDYKVLDSLITNNAAEADKLRSMGMKEDAGAFTRKFYTQVLKFYEKKGGGILQALYDVIPIAMFFMLPLFAFLLKLFYWRKGTFAHHMVFSFYYFTFFFTSFCLLLLLNRLFEIPVWIEFLVFSSFILYLVVALHNFYRSGWVAAFLKANLISFIYMLIIVPIAFIGVMAVSFMMY